MGWNKVEVLGGGDAAGGIPSPDAGVLADNEMVKANAGGTAIVGTGDTNTDLEVDFGSKILSCKSVVVEAATLVVGPAISISERGGYSQTHVNTTGRDFISTGYEVNDSGSKKPTYDQRSAKEVRVVTQPDDTQIMLNVISYDISPPEDADIKVIYLKFNNSVTNFRLEFISNVTGLPIKYWPSGNDWRKNTGVDVAAGEYQIIFETPVAELSIMPITVNILADTQIDLLGDGVNPWRAVDRLLITKYDSIDESDSVTKLSDVTNAGSGEIITTDERDKLAGLTGGRHRGVFADLAALITAYPVGADGDTATVTNPSGNLFYWNGAAWADSGTGYYGDMLKATYDPSAKGLNAFLMSSMDETANAKVFTEAERVKLAGLEAGITVAQHRKMYGHEVFKDDTTEANKYSANDGVKTQIQNNKAVQEKDLDPSIPHLIGPSGGAVLDQVNALYSIGLQITGKPVDRDKDYYLLLEIPDGDGPGLDHMVSKRFQRFAKNVQEETISMSFVVPCTADIVGQEILPYIETDGTKLNYWATKFTVTKLNGPVIP